MAQPPLYPTQFPDCWFIDPRTAQSQTEEDVLCAFEGLDG